MPRPGEKLLLVRFEIEQRNAAGDTAAAPWWDGFVRFQA
jgi:hypothetical protein